MYNFYENYDKFTKKAKLADKFLLQRNYSSLKRSFC